MKSNAMSNDITIYGIPDDPNNDLIYQMIRKLEGVSVNMVICPPSVRELYRVPFIADEKSGRYFGVEAIEQFVTKRIQGD